MELLISCNALSFHCLTDRPRATGEFLQEVCALICCDGCSREGKGEAKGREGKVLEKEQKLY